MDLLALLARLAVPQGLLGQQARVVLDLPAQQELHRMSKDPPDPRESALRDQQERTAILALEDLLGLRDRPGRTEALELEDLLARQVRLGLKVRAEPVDLRVRQAPLEHKALRPALRVPPGQPAPQALTAPLRPSLDLPDRPVLPAQTEPHHPSLGLPDRPDQPAPQERLEVPALLVPQDPLEQAVLSEVVALLDPRDPLALMVRAALVDLPGRLGLRALEAPLEVGDLQDQQVSREAR